MATALFLLGGGSALAAVDHVIPSSSGTGTLGNSIVSSGQGVSFCASGYQPNSPVTVTLNGRYYSTVTANGSGTACTTVRVRTAGQHTLRARGIGLNGGARTVSAALTVRSAVSGADDDANASGSTSGSNDDEGLLPFTGAEVGLMAAAAAALVAAGAGARIIGRRRRTTA